jgi:hypothetical protein
VASRHNPLNLPVKAGLSVRGEEKNCEKCGSCALAITAVKRAAAKRIDFLIFIDCSEN